MKLITATCSSAPKTVETRKGERLVSNYRDADGHDHVIWSPIGHSYHSSVELGQFVQLGVTSSGKVHLIEGAQQVTPTLPLEAGAPNSNEKWPRQHKILPSCCVTAGIPSGQSLKE